MLERYTLRQLVAAYLGDASVQYEFDPDHAMLAYPLRTLTVLRDELVTQSSYTVEEEVRVVLRGLFRDRSGALPEMMKFFR
jgi:hypothetical protein